MEPTPPSFVDWSTSRIQFLLADYREALRSIRILYGRNHQDARVYDGWIKAMEAELEKRKL